MSNEYNHDLCIKLHQEIDRRLDKGETTMNAIFNILRDNGKVGLMTRVDRIERAIDRNESLLWRILTPALPLIYGGIAALVVLWLQSGK